MDQVGRKAKILVVEDESIVALDMRSRLTFMGYDVVGIAASGEEALDLVKITQPDLILMDIKLQGDLDGVDTAELVHKSADIPVIFVTAFADERTLARAKVTQAFGYILKPFQEREVLISIEMALYKHRMEQDLRISREWLNGSLNAISDGVVALDSEERIVFINPAAQRLWGVENPLAIGRPIGSFCSFAENQALAGLLGPQRDQARAEEESAQDIRWLMMTTQKSKIPVELIRAAIRGPNSENIGHVLSIRDISEIVRADAVKTRLAAIVSNSFDAILSIDTDLRIVSWNLGAELIYGYSAEDIIGSSIQQILVDQKDLTQFRDLVDLVLRGKLAGRLEMVRKCRSGKTIIVSMSLSPLHDAEGKLVQIACIERDVSAEKEYEASLVQAKQNAEESSRVKGEFLSNMSHELRTPLNSIIGMVELARDMSAADEQREYLEIARQSADNLLFLINSILDFSKIEAGKMHINSIVFDPVDAVEDCMEEVSVQAHRKGLSLVFYSNPQVPSSIEGDPRRFKQILTNLLSNGIKFSESGGIRVELNTTLSADGSSAVLELSVKDTGIGIASDRLSVIWETFTQIDGSSTRAYGGTGLGLSIVKSLAELMGGAVSVSSELGKGSVFTVSLPFLLPEKSLLRLNEKPISLGVSVFLAIPFDDERVILTELLTSWGCTVHIPDTIDNVLRELYSSENDHRICFILDEKMPDRQLFFARIADSGRTDLLADKLIVLSSIGAKDDPEWKTLSGVATFLFKPIRRGSLRSCLSSLGLGTTESTEASPGKNISDMVARTADSIVREQSGSREKRIQSELASDLGILSSLERFLGEVEVIGAVSGTKLENAAARCRRELEALHATVLPQYIFKIMLACRRDDSPAVVNELSRIREAIKIGTRNGESD